MDKEEYELSRTTTLQLVRQAIRSRNLRRLKESLTRPWSIAMLTRALNEDTEHSGEYQIFAIAIEDMSDEEKRKAFQWTWDCYHELMGPLGQVLRERGGIDLPKSHL